MRCLVLIIVATVICSSTPSAEAVTGRDVMRYFGFSWSDGYHSQHAPPARCGRSMWGAVRGNETAPYGGMAYGPTTVIMPSSDHRSVTSFSPNTEQLPLNQPLPTDQASGQVFMWPQRSPPQGWPRSRPEAKSPQLPQVTFPSVSLPTFAIPWPTPNGVSTRPTPPSRGSAPTHFAPSQINRVRNADMESPTLRRPSVAKEPSQVQPVFRFPNRD
ncbi:MAG: hypothetical protein ABGX22_23380 [Pirellulaceae bacterium]